ncbi:MAG: hypothetical protein GIX03_15150, partial [Candidatus Eremiobacteraeota bacterium]|nr:hypothetical protein [Candidatus Eremiobacteraeota bacterium]
MDNVFAVETVLRLRDEATAPLRRFTATLREMQRQIEAVTAGLREMLSASEGLAAAQREIVGLTAREADLRATITGETTRQGESLVASRTRALELARGELATQREMLGVDRQRGGGASGASWSRGTSTLGWTGAGLLGVGVVATEMAAHYQQLTTETELALGGTMRTLRQRQGDMRRLQEAAQVASQATGFYSEGEVMKGLKAAAASGGRALAAQIGMDKFAAIAPSLATYMDVVGRLGNEAPEAAATQAIQFAHLFGAYNVPAIKRTLNTAALLRILVPETMKQNLTVAGYAAPTGLKLAGMSEESILALIAAADQKGIGRGRAGARIKDFIEAYSVDPPPTSAAGKAISSARQRLGMNLAVDPQNRLDVDKAMRELAIRAKTMAPRQFADTLTLAFGKPASIVAEMFGDRQGRGLYEANFAAISAAVKNNDLAKIQTALKSTPLGMQQSSMAQLQNNMIEFGKYGLPVMQQFFKEALRDLKAVSAWMEAHRSRTASILHWVVGIGGALLALGVLGSVARNVMSIVTALRWFTALGAVTGAVSSLRLAWASLGAMVAGAEVAGIPTALKGIGLGVDGLAAVLAAPAAVAIGVGLAALGGAIAAFALTTKGANVDETQPYFGRGSNFWLEYAKKHGTRAVPTDILKELQHDHLLGVAGRGAAHHAVSAGAHSVVNHFHMSIDARGATARDGKRIGEAVESGVRRALAFSQRHIRTSAAAVNLPPHMLLGIGGGTGAVT